MSPRWLVCFFCLALLMPAPVTPQVAVVIQVLKTALCTVCSAAFVLASCAPRERLLCRIIAFKLKLLCRTFPCTNYGAPSQRRCSSPFGCLPWNIRPLGLCQPFAICCNRGGSVTSIDETHGVKSGLSTMLRSKFNSKGSKKSAASIPNQGSVHHEVPPYENITQLYIPTSPHEYMKDWPQNEDDPTTVAQTIQQQYVKFMTELNAINKQETEFGRGTIRIPSFEEFRSVALGEIQV